jgi:hypothetical protein
MVAMKQKELEKVGEISEDMPPLKDCLTNRRVSTSEG